MKWSLGLVALLALSVGALWVSARMDPLTAADLESDGGRLVHFTDRSGEPIGSVLVDGERACQPVTLDQVPAHLTQALIAAEDQRFREHGGVDARALGRAALQNLKARSIVSGGSTLTMQLARMRKPKPRTLWNKIVEARTAWRLEAGMSKDEILEAYLNRAPMGSNLVGVGIGAEVHFGRDVPELNLGQCAALAAIPQDPVRNRPGTIEGAERRSYILERMVEEGYITAEEGELARKSRTEARDDHAPLAAYHLMFRAIEDAPTDAGTLELTIDSDVQRMVAGQVRRIVGELEAQGATNAAALVVGNDTGEVLAYVGSADYFDDEAGRVDGVRALRQPGSTLKPFVYALALESGYTLATPLPDVPASYPMAPGQWYEPENYSTTFHGPVRLRAALANSYNLPACHVAVKVGVSEVLRALHRAGFESLDQDADYYGLGLVLGGGEVTLYELVRAYSAVARGGELTPLRAWSLEEGEASDGPAQPTQICDPLTAYLITDTLSDSAARAPSFGTSSPLDLPFPCAAKTGTSSGHRDNWCIGYTPDYTVGVWVGDFEGEPMHDVSGISGAGPLFGRIMLHLYQGHAEPEPPERPSGIVERPVCSLSGAAPGPYCPHHVRELLRRDSLAGYGSRTCDWHQPGPDGQPRAVVPERFRVEGRP
jgi:penicillin-binding protein 1C